MIEEKEVRFQPNTVNSMNKSSGKIIPVAGKVYGEEEKSLAREAIEEFHLTAGRFNHAFESALADRLKVKSVYAVNSGSSANLLAFSALMSPLLGEKRLKSGDEVITTAVSFPTTLSPMIHFGLKPVFVDISLPEYNVDVKELEKAIKPTVKAIALAHTLGNPFDVKAVRELVEKHNLWLIEDCCDALGSLYDGSPVGSFGSISTFSFYPAHHITTGEGGAVATDNEVISDVLRSLRDWGRECKCETGHSGSCGKRFSLQRGTLPFGYDHKYIYSHAGFNFKMTDIQAAIGLAQIKKLDDFTEKRRQNFLTMKKALSGMEDYIIMPEEIDKAKASWFGFPVTLREIKLRDETVSKKSNYEFRRILCEALLKAGIDSRPLFAGNILRQPFMKDVNYRISGELYNSDRVTGSTFWTGVWPGLNEEDIGYAASCLIALLQELQPERDF